MIANFVTININLIPTLVIVIFIISLYFAVLKTTPVFIFYYNVAYFLYYRNLPI